jgi:hypothetical protein
VLQHGIGASSACSSATGQRILAAAALRGRMRQLRSNVCVNQAVLHAILRALQHATETLTPVITIPLPARVCCSAAALQDTVAAAAPRGWEVEIADVSIGSIAPELSNLQAFADPASGDVTALECAMAFDSDSVRLVVVGKGPLGAFTARVSAVELKGGYLLLIFMTGVKKSNLGSCLYSSWGCVSVHSACMHTAELPCWHPRQVLTDAWYHDS